jgi:hypothetical protein
MQNMVSTELPTTRRHRALTAFLCSSAASELSGTVISVRPPATG